MPLCPWKLINIDTSEKILENLQHQMWPCSTAVRSNCRRQRVLRAGSLIFSYGRNIIHFLEGSKIRKLLSSLLPPISKEDTLGVTCLWKQWYTHFPVISRAQFATMDQEIHMCRALWSSHQFWQLTPILGSTKTEPAHWSFEFNPDKFCTLSDVGLVWFKVNKEIIIQFLTLGKPESSPFTCELQVSRIILATLESLYCYRIEEALAEQGHLQLLNSWNISV